MGVVGGFRFGVVSVCEWDCRVQLGHIVRVR